MEAKDKIKEMISSVFDVTDPPECVLAHGPGPYNDDEDDSIAAPYEGKYWNELNKQDQCRSNYDTEFAFFTSQAVQYYFPGWMLLFLDEDVREYRALLVENFFDELLAIRLPLSPDDLYYEIKRWIVNLTLRQKQVVASWIKIMMMLDPYSSYACLEEHREPVEAYWNQFLPCDSQLRQTYTMPEGLKADVLKYFPANGILSYEDFVCDDIINFHYRNDSMSKKIFDLISCPWTEIQWADVERPGLFFVDTYGGGYLVISKLSSKSFIHVFPSLLVEVARNQLTTSDYFLFRHLDIRSVIRDWERKFYSSFSKDIVRLINRVLKANGSSCAKDAIDVYWHESTGGKID
jgi:hypothetical protein